jgi:hypothetical protein
MCCCSLAQKCLFLQGSPCFTRALLRCGLRAWVGRRAWLGGLGEQGARLTPPCPCSLVEGWGSCSLVAWGPQ